MSEARPGPDRAPPERTVVHGALLALGAAAVLVQAGPPPIATVASLALMLAVLVRELAARGALQRQGAAGLAARPDRGRTTLPSWRQALVVLGVLATLQGLLWLQGGRWRDPERVLARIESDYRRATRELSDLAGRIASQLEPPRDREARLGAFGQLEALLGQEGDDRRLTVLLVNGDGEVVAWAGAGLRHSLPDVDLVEHGLDYVASFTAVTLFAVEPIEDVRRPWRVVVGRSDSTGRLPFGPDWLQKLEPERGGAWTLARHGVRAPSALWTVEVPKAPVLRGKQGLLSRAPDSNAWRLLPVLVACGWALWLVLSASAAALPGWLGKVERVVVVALCVAVPTVMLGGGAPTIALCVAGAVAPTAAWLGSGLPRRSRAHDLMAVAASTLGLLVLVLVLRAWCAGASQLADATAFSTSAQTWLLRLGGWGLVAGLLTALVPRAEAGHDGGSLDPLLRRAIQALLVLAMAGAAWCLDSFALALALLLLAGALSPLALPSRRGTTFWGVLVVLAAWLSAIAWLVCLRAETSERLLTEVARAADRHTEEERIARLRDALAGLDVSDLALGVTPYGVQAQDLALAVWQATPLARGGVLSSVRVGLPEDTPSRFSFGLPDVEPEGGDLSGSGAAVFGAAYRLIAALSVDGEPWASIEVRALPLPVRSSGAQLATAQLTRELLGGIGEDRMVAELPGGGRLVVDDARQGEVGEEDRYSEAPRLREDVLGSWAIGRDGALRASLYLGQRSGLEGLSSVAAYATALLLVLGMVAVLALATLAIRRGQRERLEAWASSYPRRLMLIFSVLLGVPLLLINILVFQALEDRVRREQRTNGEAALSSAERIIADYLPTLEPGFSIDTALDDERLKWLSRITRHEVNLYWRGFVSASSRPELFAAGVLPRRIPGAALARLALGREVVAERRHEIGSGLSYLELYRRVALPGEQPDVTGLFLSVPLLAQQEEATRELRALFERSLSVTVLLFLVLFGVGSRLAARFTEPVMDIVARTERIAGGATTLGLHPSEPELATLVAAIDAMAVRLAEGRESLLREKQVVDGVVANITSAVVSFGHDRRVQMRNRVAEELLGAQPGDSYAELARRSSLPLRQLLEVWPTDPKRTTVRIGASDGEEQEWTLAWVPVEGEGDPAALLVVEDVTEVLRGQRLEAWAEMARMIAHEIKNPLTPIRLSAEHLKRVHAEASDRLDEVFDRCLDNILDQVEELKETAAAFSTYSRIPEARFETRDLNDTLLEVVDGYRAHAASHLDISLTLDPALDRASSWAVPHDRKLIARVVRNLLENAIQAGGGHGVIEVEARRCGAEARVSVSDRGSGVAEEALPRIFEPSFSTTSGGTGLGLAICRRIVEEHGGRIEAHNRPGGGLIVSFTLPGEAPIVA